MATEIGTAYATIAPKLSDDFDSTIAKGVDKASKAGGASGGKSFGSSFSVAAGNLMSDAMGKVIGSITSHIGSAISRVDALNQFPKVMANIGFSADDASAAMGKLSDGIQGLPTTLDDIVGNAQQLALSLGDLDQAADVTIALNDGMLMFGASSSEVTGAITQLNQMITAGKFDMQSWNSINQAAPGLMDTVAKSMLGAGATAGELRESLNSGTVSTQELLDAFVSLDKNGGDGVASFSEGVKSATGGIETSASRIDSAITRNIANIINMGAEAIGFSSICDKAVQVVNFLGSAIGNGLESAIRIITPAVEFLTDAMGDLDEQVNPWLTDAVKWLADTLGTLLVGAVVAATTVIAGIVEGIAKFIGFVKNAKDAAAEGAQGILTSIVDTLSGLPGQALQWGADLIENLKEGIKNKISSLVSSVVNVASTIRSYLHFSEPDVGPLSDFHTYMPDMLKGMARDIKDNAWRLDGALVGLSTNISQSVNPASDRGTLGGITIANLVVSADDALTARSFESMLRREAALYA